MVYYTIYNQNLQLCGDYLLSLDEGSFHRLKLQIGTFCAIIHFKLHETKTNVHERNCKKKYTKETKQSKDVKMPTGPKLSCTLCTAYCKEKKHFQLRKMRKMSHPFLLKKISSSWPPMLLMFCFFWIIMISMTFSSPLLNSHIYAIVTWICMYVFSCYQIATN